MPSKAVDTPVPPTRTLEELLTADDSTQIEEDPKAIAARIVAQILSAQTAEDVYAAAGTIATAEMKGIPLELRDVKLLESKIEGSSSTVYAVLEVMNLDTGELQVLNSSSPRIMAQAVRSRELGLLPLKVVVIEVAPARPGKQAPLGLERL